MKIGHTLHAHFRINSCQYSLPPHGHLDTVSLSLNSFTFTLSSSQTWSYRQQNNLTLLCVFVSHFLLEVGSRRFISIKANIIFIKSFLNHDLKTGLSTQVYLGSKQFPNLDYMSQSRGIYCKNAAQQRILKLNENKMLL